MEVLLKDLRYIVTQDEDRRVLRGKDILIKEGFIEEIGNIKGPVDEVVDCSEYVAIPGLINTHTHVPMVLFRGVADDMDLFPWLQEKIWPMESKLTPYHIKAGTRLGLLEAVRTGTTTLFDMYFFEGVIAEEFVNFGVRGVLGQAIIDFGTPECSSGEECLKLADNFVSTWINKNSLVEPSYGPHAPYTVSPERLAEIAGKSSELGVYIQIHLAETRKEVEDLRGKYGRGPIELAHSSGILGDKTVAAHVVWPSYDEMMLLSRSRTLVSHNPVSNLKLASGISPVPDLISLNVIVTLGTDGAASNNTLDMMETMKITAILHKAIKGDPTVVPAQSVLDMATIIPGEFLRWKIGRIVPGYEADIVLLKTRVPWWTPLHSVVSHIVYSARSTDVHYVFIAGKPIIEKGLLSSEREEEIICEAEKASLDLLERSGVSSLLKNMN